MRDDDKNVLAKEFFIYIIAKKEGRKERRDRMRTSFENPVHIIWNYDTMTWNYDTMTWNMIM